MKYRYLKNVVTLKLEQEKCNGCGMCLEVCPQQVFTLENGSSIINDRDACMECSACANNCPRQAIYVRRGVGCAYAVLMDKFNIKGGCCNETQCCILPETESRKEQP